MESSNLEEKNIIKDLTDFFRLKKLKKETIDTTIKIIRNLFIAEKENEKIKDRILRDMGYLFRWGKENKAIKDIQVKDIRNLFQNEVEENHNKPVTVYIFWSNSYIEHKCNGDKNNTLSIEEYLNKIRTYLEDIIANLKKSETWKIQLTIAKSFMSPIDNDEECVMRPKSDNIKDL